MTSVKISATCRAISTETGRLTAITPPKAETGSHSWARRWASATSAPTAMPHGFACLMIATAGSSKSAAARRAAYDFDEPAVAIIKHANPCGIAVGADVAEAHRKAHECDPVSAFGGVIAVNRPVSVEMAKQVAEVFTEVIVAPAYEEGAVEVLQGKKNVRILECEPLHRGGAETRPISGGLLMQQRDLVDAEGDDPSTWTLATGEAASEELLADLAFAWKACRAAKSNAILLARDGASVGIGMGQVNRVDSCRLAVSRAGDRAKGSVAASDAFFPFEDGPQILIDAGVTAIVQPGGSVRDELTVEAAKAAGVTMYFTGTRHFFH